MAARPIGIDLFSGAGGLSLGFEQAGFDVVGAVELDPVHAAVHKFNFPHCTVVPNSVIGLKGDEIRRLCGIGRRRIDVVFGGAPCQGFSMIGQRAFDDPRNALVREFVRLVGELPPAIFVFENVKGLTVGKHRKFLDELVSEFEGLGYRIRQPWQVLNASSHGVPQDRERLFLLGARRGIDLPRYPVPTSCAAGTKRSDLPQGPSCADAIGDLPRIEDYSTLVSGDAVRIDKWKRQSRFAAELRCSDEGAWHFGYKRRWQSNDLTSSMRTEHTKISMRRFAETPPGSVEPISRYFRLPADGVSNTLRAETDSARGAFTSPRPIHYSYPRCVTVREMARLHGFPDWFRFHMTKWHGARQVGNSVPPPLARAVAKGVIDALGVIPSRPNSAIALGDPSLLAMDMSEASAFWGVVAPIGRRDRKSGAKKRKQHEIEAARSTLGGLTYG